MSAGPRRIGRWAGCSLAAGAAAVMLFAMARAFPGVTESVYGRGIYPYLARALSTGSAVAPFSLAEFVFAGIVVAWLFAPVAGFLAARRAGRGVAASSAAAAIRLAASVAGVVALFVALWGLNYARPRAGGELGLASGAVSREKAEPLVAGIGRELDALRRALPEDERGVVRSPGDWRELDAHLARLQAEVLESHGLPAVPSGRIKCFLASPLLLRWRVSGVYGPFTGEPNVALPAFPGGLPFTLAHERAHLSGFAREDEASLVALLTVWRSDRPEVRYSGWLELWMALGRDGTGREPGVGRDLVAIAHFIAEHAGREAPAARKAYDTYLKALGVREGVRSYGGVAGLALRYLERSGMPTASRRER